MKLAIKNTPWNVSRGFPGSHSVKLMYEKLLYWKINGELNVPVFDKFEKLIVDIGWESLDDWFNFWNNQRNILSIDQYWNNKVNDDWIWGLALPLLSQAYKLSLIHI